MQVKAVFVVVAIDGLPVRAFDRVSLKTVARRAQVAGKARKRAERIDSIRQNRFRSNWQLNTAPLVTGYSNR
jgi:hypothetical protein